MHQKSVCDHMIDVIDATLARAVARLRDTDSGTAHTVFLIREILDHAACINRLGSRHSNCGCPRALARRQLLTALRELYNCEAGRPAPFRNMAQKDTRLDLQDTDVL